MRNIRAVIRLRDCDIVYDTIGRTQYHPDSVRLDLIEAVCTAGRSGQILLGLDLGKRS